LDTRRWPRLQRLTELKAIEWKADNTFKSGLAGPEGWVKVSGVGRGERLGLPPEDQWHPSQLPSKSVPPTRGADEARPTNATEIPLKVVTEPPTPDALAEDRPHPDHQWHSPEPRLIRDAGLWVWIWVIGAIVLIVLLIVALAALPSGSGHHGASEVVQIVSAPNIL
jgi:hypothetical protein